MNSMNSSCMEDEQISEGTMEEELEMSFSNFDEDELLQDEEGTSLKIFEILQRSIARYKKYSPKFAPNMDCSDFFYDFKERVEWFIDRASGKFLISDYSSDDFYSKKKRKITLKHLGSSKQDHPRYFLF